MATKTANVLARVEPEVKEQAEAIMMQLGVPASTVINMLYKQIILQKRIPFALAVPNIPKARDEMTEAEFDSMMELGLMDAKEDHGKPVAEAFSELRQRIQ